MLINSFKTMLGQDMVGRFMNGDFSKTNIVLRTHISSSNDFMNTRKKIEAYLAENLPAGFSFQVTGIGVVISHSSELITDGQIKSLFLTLVLVFAIMFLLFMSFKVGIIGILPNCFPILVGFGLMGWLEYLCPWPQVLSPESPSVWQWMIPFTIWWVTTTNSKKIWTKNVPFVIPFVIWESRSFLPR